MFDIGFQEILMVSVLALLIMGPERLPGAIRTGSLWLAKIRRSFADMKQEIENEIGLDPDQIKLQLHNEQVLKNIEESKKRFQENLQELEQGAQDFSDYAASGVTPPANSRAGQQVQEAKEAGLKAKEHQADTATEPSTDDEQTAQPSTPAKPDQSNSQPS